MQITGELIDELKYVLEVEYQYKSCGEIYKPTAISNGMYLYLHSDCM